MILLTASDSLRIVLAGAVATTQADLYASFLDVAEDASTAAPGNVTGTTNDTTPVDWLSAPVAGICRQAKYLSIFNRDSTSISAVISLYDGANTRRIHPITSLVGEKCEFVDGFGWRVFQADGTARSENVSGASGPPCDFIVALGDETTNITTGAAKVTFRATRAMNITEIRASLGQSSSSGAPAFDVNKNGASVFTTTLTIDQGEETSLTATTPAVLDGGNLAIAKDDEITIDIDTAGTGAKGAKILFVGTF